MKTNAFKTLTLPFIIVAAFLFTACDEDAQKPSETGTASKEKADKVLSLREDLNFINRFVASNVDLGSEAGRVSLIDQTIARITEAAPCAEAVEEELADGSIKINLDFGDGCETEDGVEVAGKVVMIFHITEVGIQFEIEFIDYSELGGANEGEVVNGIVEGNFILDLSSFVQELQQDLSIKYANGLEAAYKITQRAEMTETGMRVTVLTTSGNLADGAQFATTLSKSIVYDFNCEGDFPVRGEELLTFQGNTILLNYGNGSCDDEYSVK